MRPFLVAFLDRLLAPGWGESLAPTYVIMLSLAMIAGALIALDLGRRAGFDMRRGMGALLGAWLGALVGGRLLTVFVNIPDAYAAGNASLMTLRGGFGPTAASSAAPRVDGSPWDAAIFCASPT